MRCNRMARPITYCSVDGCGTRTKGNGLCNRHYMRNLRRGSVDPAPYKKPSLPPIPCLRCGARAEIRKRELCRRCYADWLRNGDREARCSVDSCNRSLYANGHCILHYNRLRRTSSLEYTPRTLEERFWEKVNFDGPIPEYRPDLGPCWLWTAADTNGYGIFGIGGGANSGAHRVAYALLREPVLPNRHLDHLCRVPLCVNPFHLEPVTSWENARRAWMARLESPPHCPTCSCSYGLASEPNV